MIVSIILDVLLIALLAVMIFYCYRLNKHLSLIRDSKNELGDLIRQFSEATAIAGASVEELKNNSKKVVEDLSTRIEKGNFIADDLSFLIDKASKLADQMETRVTSAKPSSPSPAASRMSPQTDVTAKSKAEADLMQALKGMK